MSTALIASYTPTYTEKGRTKAEKRDRAGLCFHGKKTSLLYPHEKIM